MKNVFAKATLVALVLAFAKGAVADAPRNPPQYEPFDQDTIEITDKLTKLTWDRSRVVAGGIARDAATLYCSSTVFPSGGRLPTVKELLTIVDEDPHEEYDTALGRIVLKSIDRSAFPDTPTDLPYWTSTPGPNGTFWSVSFETGKLEAITAGTKLHARCVK